MDEKKVVLKVDMRCRCEGCVNKVINCARNIHGVETVKADWDAKKLTVIGKVDPEKVRENLEKKTKNKFELLSPLPNKETKNKKKEKKPKEPTVTKAVLKLSLDCNACVKKVHKILSKTPGLQTLKMDRKNHLVTVKGTMDAEALAETIRCSLKTSVEIVPPPKQEETRIVYGTCAYGCPVGCPHENGPNYAFLNPPEWYVFSDENPNACSIL